MSQERKETSLEDERSARRKSLEAPLTMRIEAHSIGGTSDNVSSVGILFFTEEPLRVTIELRENGATKTYSGRLARVQRMNEAMYGLAVEFDAEE